MRSFANGSHCPSDSYSDETVSTHLSCSGRVVVSSDCSVRRQKFPCSLRAHRALPLALGVLLFVLPVPSIVTHIGKTLSLLTLLAIDTLPGVGLATVYGLALGGIRLLSKGLLMPVIVHAFADLTIFLIIMRLAERW